MTVEAKAGVPSNVYLRSFYGDTYENGRWIKKSDFSGMEKEYHDASRMTAWQTTIGLATLLDGYYDDETNPYRKVYNHDEEAFHQIHLFAVLYRPVQYRCQGRYRF